ncbi:MAG TPA: hypothetical protein VH227_05410 [Candidatus Udaeobacter sp.]|nr:hypothetical protein [Candidatus Udaeobacter sp.]
MTLVAAVALYLIWLWQPEHQVRLHSQNFFRAIDHRNWDTVADFIDNDYQDQWADDRTRLLERMREGFRWIPGSKIMAPDSIVNAEARHATWSGKITVYSSDDDVMDALDQRVNKLPTPFELEWHRLSTKPWDWKLTRVSNRAFEIPADTY